MIGKIVGVEVGVDFVFLVENVEVVFICDFYDVGIKIVYFC